MTKYHKASNENYLSVNSFRLEKFHCIEISCKVTDAISHGDHEINCITKLQLR